MVVTRRAALAATACSSLKLFALFVRMSLSQTQTRAASVFVNKFDTGRF